MSYHPVLAKRSLILVQLLRGPSTRINLAKALGFTAPLGIAREVNQLIKDGKVEEDAAYKCPHCDNIIEGISVKKGGMKLILTLSGETEATNIRARLLTLLEVEP